MAKLTLGCSTLAFGRFELHEALKAIAEIGFPVIDLACIKGMAEHFDLQNASQANCEALNEKIRSYGLRASTLNVNAGSFTDPESRDQHALAVRAALHCGSVLGCACVTTKVGDAVDGNWEEGAGEAIVRIRELAEHAHSLKMKLSLEMPHTGTLAASLEQSVRLFEMIQHQSVDVTLDTSQLHQCGAEIRETSRQFIGKLGHVHLRDLDEKETHLIPGDGMVDFAFVHSMMTLAGFHRDYVLEVRLPDDKSLDEIKADLARGREHLLPELGLAKKKKKAKKAKKKE